MTTTAPAPINPIQVAGLVADYFGPDARPALTQVFVPARGWRFLVDEEPATIATVKHHKMAGVTAVAVRSHAPGVDRVADFTVREILAYADRPLLGGSAL